MQRRRSTLSVAGLALALTVTAVAPRAAGAAGPPSVAGTFTPTFTPGDCPSARRAGPGDAPTARSAPLGGSSTRAVSGVLSGGAPDVASRLLADAGFPSPAGTPGGPAAAPPATTGATPADNPAAAHPAVRCGWVRVPLDHRDPRRGTIEVAVGVFPALQPPAGGPGDPLVVLGGGPGQQVLGSFADADGLPGSPVDAYHRSRDLVVIEQRGIGASRPALDCPELDTVLAALPPDTSDADTRVAMRAAVAACHDRLVGAGIDLSAFNTANNARDLDLVRQALGYHKLNLFGTSYGARLAWQATRLFPATLASVVLSSPVPAEEDWLIDVPTSYRRALDAMVGACRADAGCSASYPDLGAEVDRALRRLHDAPLSVTVRDGQGRSAAVPFDDEDLAALLFSAFYSPLDLTLVPFLVDRAAAGDPSALDQLAERSASAGTAGTSFGMHLSFVCAEEVGHLDRAELGRNLWRGGAHGRAMWHVLGDLRVDLCRVWSVPPGDPEVFRPIRSQVPTLVVTGEFDQVTPPSYGETIHRQAAGSQYVEVPGVGHSPMTAGGPCALGMLDAFLADPHRPVDASCFSTASPFLRPDQAAALLGLPAPAPAPAPGSASARPGAR